MKKKIYGQFIRFATIANMAMAFGFVSWVSRAFGNM